ncbi:hypothetical protein C5B96_12265 [Subtercola sp. Z020]|uniref:hypothetical protein n=1 Tax=Subtercola sp. Z020 TaxID=2080582 RepID=UPI000CE8FE2F|nr:hypothetical protein [Subtercola sp. Z020]PPF79643.1 hypothetical protein C5B96_12265 [Subtercola sp. Z020]
MGYNESGVREIRQIVSIAATERAIYAVKTIYDETDAVNAAGHVVWADWNDEHTCLDPDRDRGMTALSTNDSILAIWASPQGHLWVTSANGTVYTTAPVTWPPPRWEPLDWDGGGSDADLPWSVTTLPDWAGGYAPQINAVWGSSDTDVHFATYRGTLYHWNGELFEITLETGAMLVNLHGSASDDVYCVGQAERKQPDQTAAWHWNGTRWSPVATPEGVQVGLLTGVRALPEGRVIAVGTAGLIFEGTPSGLEVLLDAQMSMYSIALFDGEFYAAGGRSGLWKIEGDDIVCIKDRARALGLFECGPMLLMTADDQEDAPELLQYAPRIERPWMRLQF